MDDQQAPKQHHLLNLKVCQLNLLGVMVFCFLAFLLLLLCLSSRGLNVCRLLVAVCFFHFPFVVGVLLEFVELVNQ